MSHSYLVRKILLKSHRGEPLTAEEQAILDAEMADLPSGRMWEKIKSHVESQRGRVVVLRPWYVRWPAVAAAVAAVVAVVVMVSVVANRYYRPRTHSGDLAVQPVWQMVTPGHYHAEVAGANGIVEMDSAGAHQSNPYPVLLPDGSTVTLSYATSVRYLAAFVQRKVELAAGEVYFDIAKREGKAFEVVSGKTIVDVLGTTFNWMHYAGVPDEITLLSGKIRLREGEVQRELKPAERAVIVEGKPTLVKVEQLKQPEDNEAWRTRRTIMLDSTDLYTVIQRLAQYYKVGFEVAPELRTGWRMNGIVDLQRPLGDNLAPIREMYKSEVRIAMEDSRIVVTKVND